MMFMIMKFLLHLLVYMQVMELISYHTNYITTNHLKGCMQVEYHCRAIDGDRAPLSPKLEETFNFKTTISTNLKILTLGHSVGLQFHETLEEAANVHNYTERKVLRYAWKTHPGTSISKPIRGKGVLGSLRLTGWYLRDGEGKRSSIQQIVYYDHGHILLLTLFFLQVFKNQI